MADDATEEDALKNLNKSLDEATILDRILDAAWHAMKEEVNKLHEEGLLDKNIQEIRRHYEFQTGCALAGYLEGRALVLGMKYEARKRIFRHMYKAGLKAARDEHLSDCSAECAGHTDIVAELESSN